MALRYVCSLPNPGTDGVPHELFYTDDEVGRSRAEKFSRRENKPGRGVYDCIGVLKAGAKARRKDDVAELEQIVVDLDLKNIKQPRDEVLQCLRQLALSPSEIRDSGFGLHAVWRLKEAVDDEAGLSQAESVMKRLVELLAGDPAPAHRAALLRRPGTDNSKQGEPRPCRIIEASDAEFDIIEFEDLFDLYGNRPLLTRKQQAAGSNGHDKKDREFKTSEGRLDVKAALAAMEPNGASVNDIQPRVILSLLQKAEHPNDVIDMVVDATMQMAARNQLPWTREVEVAAVTKRVRSGLELLGREYDPTTGTVPLWLAQEFHDDWAEKLAQGAHPILRRTGFGCGWCVQARPDGRKAVAANKQCKASGRLADPGEPANEKPPKKYRFPLLRFGEMRPGTEPDYLVDELIPMGGLVVVYGAPKSGKSFWVLDLALHIALAWEYRDRAVQQGTVIYCAFEGAHGYRKRCEAFRRCHGLTDEDPPLYVVPGRADLIKDHSALIKDMHGQLGASATTVRCVVLDTLNKSLIGSESKDVDMANYIAAAEAIQATFNCVVIIVHHHGIDESRPRGHTSLRGAVAAQIKITRDEQNNIIAEIEDMRDGPDGAQILSRLAVVDVGTDVAGKPLTSAAVEPIETGVGAGGRKLPKLTKNQRTFFSILQSVATGLTADEWYEQARQAGLGAKRRADLHDLRSSLKNRGLVQQTENRWFVAAEYRKCSD
jgi:hypothetical protein